MVISLRDYYLPKGEFVRFCSVGNIVAGFVSVKVDACGRRPFKLGSFGPSWRLARPPTVVRGARIFAKVEAHPRLIPAAPSSIGSLMRGGRNLDSDNPPFTILLFEICPEN